MDHEGLQLKRSVGGTRQRRHWRPFLKGPPTSRCWFFLGPKTVTHSRLLKSTKCWRHTNRWTVFQNILFWKTFPSAHNILKAEPPGTLGTLKKIKLANGHLNIWNKIYLNSIFHFIYIELNLKIVNLTPACSNRKIAFQLAFSQNTPNRIRQITYNPREGKLRDTWTT